MNRISEPRLRYEERDALPAGIFLCQCLISVTTHTLGILCAPNDFCGNKDGKEKRNDHRDEKQSRVPISFRKALQQRSHVIPIGF